MKENLGKIHADGDNFISILQYLSSDEVSIELEIKNISSGQDTNVTINQFFHTSPDFLALEAKVTKQRSIVFSLESEKSERWFAETKKLEHLEEGLKQFKADALRLGDTLLKIKPRTERLRKARELYELGRFKEVDKLLDESDLTNDQDELFALMDYYEARQKDIFSFWNKTN